RAARRTARSWPAGTSASCGRTWTPAGVARRCLPSATTPSRRSSSNVFARAACWRPRGPAGCPSSAPSSTASSATSPAPSRARATVPPPDVPADDASQSRLFDRTWARAIMEEAARLQRERAAEGGPEAVRRVELLRLRFEENLPIRAIAELWKVDPAKLHHAYALAREEFRAALLEVVAFHQPGSPAELEQEAAGL